jgi:hypothetical protein
MRGIAIFVKFMNRKASFARRTRNAHRATTALRTRRFDATELVELRVATQVVIALRRETLGERCTRS